MQNYRISRLTIISEERRLNLTWNLLIKQQLMTSRYYIIILIIFILSCNADQQDTSTQSRQSASPKILPELNTGTKSNFKKIEILPDGIEMIFGKIPTKENGFYKFSFPRQDLNVMLEGIKIDPR